MVRGRRAVLLSLFVGFAFLRLVITTARHLGVMEFDDIEARNGMNGE